MQTHFNGSQWVGSAKVEDWVEASSCSCARVFSYVTATDFGQSTERMCETLWVRCNGEAPEDRGPCEVFDEPFHVQLCTVLGRVRMLPLNTCGVGTYG